MKARYSPQDVWYADAGLFTLGSDDLRSLVSHAFSLIPADIVDHIMETCLVATVLTEEMGTYIPKELVGDKSLILFPETLLQRDRDEAVRTVLHEVAHLVHNHRSPATSRDVNYEAQEQEAWAQVDEWLTG